MARKSTGIRIIIAILIFIGIIALLDKIAGTNILDILYEKFIYIVKQVAEILGGGP